MGSSVCTRALAPQFLGLQADVTRMDVYGGKGDLVKQSPGRTEWHSISVNDSSMPEVEYRFKLVERKDGSDTRTSVFGSQDVFREKSKLDLSLCGLTKYVDSNGSGDEAKPFVSFCDSMNEECSPYITMEALDSSNGVKEVRVSFHGVEDSRKVGTEKGFSQSSTHDLDDGCLSLVSQLRAFFSGPKLFCGGLLSGDSKHSLFEGLGTVIHSFKTSDAPLIAASTDESSTKKVNQQEHTTAPTAGAPKASSVGIKELPTGSIFEPRDFQARCDALPLAHYRPDCSVWCSGDQEQKRDVCTTVPSPNANSTVHMNSKKPPKPPKPPRHPGKTSSLDEATIAAAKAAAARRKALKQAVAKRKAKALAPAASGGTPIIALLLTLGFGILMVFQGLFVQGTATQGDGKKSFVDAPSGLFDLPVETTASYGVSYQLGSEVQSASQVVDPGEADLVISNAFHKSMQEIELSRSSLADDGTASG